jgi:CubicO group peptidase (beta-lactamase class C family)
MSMQSHKKIDLKQVGARMDAGGIAGTSIATARGNEKPSTMVLGKEMGSQSPVTPETVFGAASLSKPLFAYLVLKLIQANSGVDVTDDAMAASAFGRGSDTAKKAKETNMDVLGLGQFNLPDGVTHFDLDTPLKDILPYEELNEADKARGELMTARMILSHQTGLNIGALKFDFEPGSGNCGYSGLPFGYLQKVVEKLTGSTLEELAQEFVFKPLHMDYSSFALGYDLCLMSSLPESGQPDRNKLYVEYNKENNELCYRVLNRDDIGISGVIKKSRLDEIEEKIGSEKFVIFLEALKASDLMKLQPFLTEILDITSEKDTRARNGDNSLHTTASDYALFCTAWMNDKNDSLQAAFVPAVFMMKDNVINDKVEPNFAQVSHDDLKRVAFGLGWELQTDGNGVPTMAYHTGDMNEWRATVAMNLKDKSVTVYFSNAEIVNKPYTKNGHTYDNFYTANGHILQDLIISPNGELENGLNYFRKYPFARTQEELPDGWRENPGHGVRKLNIPELKAENASQIHHEIIEDISQSLAPASRSSRSVIIGTPPISGYPRANQNNVPATNKVDSDPNSEYDDAQSKSTLPNPYATPTLKPPGHKL